VDGEIALDPVRPVDMGDGEEFRAKKTRRGMAGWLGLLGGAAFIFDRLSIRRRESTS
jgi:hypothetical protein